ncbi:MAG: ABC transporter ATP-binding protein [Pseudomonadota bacterium]
MSSEDANDTPVLSVRDLVVEIPTRAGILRPVDHVSFDIARGEILGVVGESGAGKSMTGNAVIGLIDRPGHIASGEIWLSGTRIDNLKRDPMRHVRGRRIGMVFQDPMASLNPLISIGDQLTETIREHLPVSEKQARDRAVAALEEVGIPAAGRRLDSYPHEFSGGMRQRVVLALALSAEPELVIADEPTTALDVSVQAQIVALLKRLCRERGTAVMLITHDMGVIAETANRVAVMYAGRLAEIGTVRDVIQNPSHPYTKGLMGSTPSTNPVGGRLNQIPGAMPRLTAVPPGCAFHPRCGEIMDRCRQEVPAVRPAGASQAACLLYHDAVATGGRA